jgi:hypothetical protein
MVIPFWKNLLDTKRSLGSIRFGLMMACILAQVATISITWELWQVRTYPPHLPVVELPQIPFAIPMLLSLALLPFSPLRGLAVHFGVLLISCVFDQMRTQPQFFAICLLMYGTLNETGLWWCRWLNISMWLWAGLQKFLSPDWFGKSSWDIVVQCYWPGEWHLVFAMAIATFELTHGLLAIFLPRIASWTCVALHVGVVIFLTPLFYNWNYSVIPWNLASAAVGFWMLRQSCNWQPKTFKQRAVVAVVLLYPIGFFFGVVDHGFSGVLYSDNIPRGLITKESGIREIRGWGKLSVPFPNERRLLKAHFERSSPPGSKLHIEDPRPLLEDLYFMKPSSPRAIPISRERFFAESDDEVRGIGLDSNESIYELSKAGVRMLKRSKSSMIYAVEIPPASYHPRILKLLDGIPNLEQLQLKNCSVRDEDLKLLAGQLNLIGIGLDGTSISDSGLKHLAQLPKLVFIEHDNTQITADGLKPWRGDSD